MAGLMCSRIARSTIRSRTEGMSRKRSPFFFGITTRVRSEGRYVPAQSSSANRRCRRPGRPSSTPSPRRNEARAG